MIFDSYDLEAAKGDFSSFEFISAGPKGKIRKIIRFEKFKGHDIYNLGFGDYDKTKDKVDDLTVSDNKDSDKILATIGSAFVLFMDQNPTATVIIQGSTASRMRFFLRKISKYLTQILQEFELWGEIENSRWEIFRSNTWYKSVLIRKK